MLVHTVLFWLEEGLSSDQIAEFRAGLETLEQIESAESVYVGTPANTPPRPDVLINTYDFCLTVVLEDTNAHDVYQADPKHKAFLKNFSSYIERVRVYDAD